MTDPGTSASGTAVGRNDPCPCGSGRKFKQCCGALAHQASAQPPDFNALHRLYLSASPARLEEEVRAQLKLHPGAGTLWYFLALALQRQGKPNLEAYAESARLSPEDPGPVVNMGNRLAAMGRLDEAIASFEQALRLKPRFTAAHLNLGQALLAHGVPARAAGHFRQVLEDDPGAGSAHHGLARALGAMGDYPRAIQGMNRALHAGGVSEAEVLHDLGDLLERTHQAAEAEACYRRALTEWEPRPETYIRLGNLLRAHARLEEAVSCYRQAIALRPQLIEAHHNLAVALRLLGDTVQAQAAAQAALEFAPGCSPAMTTIAQLHADQGEFSAAKTWYRKALAATPGLPDALAGLSRLHRNGESDAEWLGEAMRQLERPMAPSKESVLRYALGRYFDGLGDCAQAFAHYERANALDRLQQAPYRPKLLSSWVDECIRQFDKAPHPSGLRSTERSVLIIGMLRSGTTLAEQILAAHTAVAGAGELLYWPRVSRDAKLPGPDEIQALAAGYRQELARRGGAALRVVDKMPGNFLHLGLIHAALPHVRIIHLRRDPRDTCLSIYFQHFEGFHNYASDLANLAHFYGEYRRLMAHWHAIFPPHTLLELNYEDLVSDPETWSRRMVGFIDLPWDERCLAPQAVKRNVLTASHWQVRQPINTAAVGRWRRYAQYLEPLSVLEAPAAKDR